LKYVIGKEQERQKQKVHGLHTLINSLDSDIQKIQFDEIEKRVELTNELQSLHKHIEEVESKAKIHQSIADNNFDNINVQQDYFRRTLDKEFKEIKQRLDLQDSLHNRDMAKVFDLYSSLTADKEQEVKEEPKQEQEVVTPTTEATTKEEKISEYEELSVKLRKSKKESKRVIRSRELEKYFKQVTKLTFRGYVLKFGQEEFQKQRLLVYKKLYYQKFIKPLMSEITPTQIEMEMDIPSVG
jgi:hypothetical protein